DRGGPLLVLAVSAAGPKRRRRRAARRLDPAGPHLGVSHVQLFHAARALVLHPVARNDAKRFSLAVAATRRGAGTGSAARGLGQPVSGVARESQRAAASPAVPHDPEALSQGRGGRRERVAGVST